MPGLRLCVVSGCEIGSARIRQIGITQQLFHDIGVEHALLLQIMRNGILGQKGRLEPDFGANPFGFGMGFIRRVIAASAAAELRAEVCTLNLIELLDLPPSFVADGSRNIDFQSHDRHT